MGVPPGKVSPKTTLQNFESLLVYKKYSYVISEETGIAWLVLRDSSVILLDASFRAAICIVVIAHSILVFDVKATDVEVQRKKTCYMKPEKNQAITLCHFKL